MCGEWSAFAFPNLFSDNIQGKLIFSLVEKRFFQKVFILYFNCSRSPRHSIKKLNTKNKTLILKLHELHKNTPLNCAVYSYLQIRNPSLKFCNRTETHTQHFTVYIYIYSQNHSIKLSNCLQMF